MNMLFLTVLSFNLHYCTILNHISYFKLTNYLVGASSDQEPELVSIMVCLYNTVYAFNSARPCRVGLVVSVSASHMVGHEFASRPRHTKNHYKNGTNCLPAWHAMR